MLRTQTTIASTAHLTLAIGSREGTVAPLQLGYYMIGRHSECQLRPKSRSVSRRHCLLHHSEHGLRVMDLKSTTGTLINDLIMEPHQWKVLKDGDLLRCGKVLFSVGIEPNQQENQVDSKRPETVDSLTDGDPWQETDVAEFLNAADDADREQRYAGIRTGNRQSKFPSSASANSDDGNTESGGTEADEWGEMEFEDTVDFLTDAGSESKGDIDAKVDSELAVGSTGSEQEKDGEKRPAKSKAKMPRQPPKIPKARRASRFSLQAISFPSFSSGNGQLWKMIGAVVLTIGMVGFCCYTTYQVFYGVDVRVVRGID